MRCEFNLHPHLGPVIFCTVIAGCARHRQRDQQSVCEIDKVLWGRLTSKDPENTFQSWASLLPFFFFFSGDNQTGKGWYWFKTSPVQPNHALCHCSVRGELIWKRVLEGSQLIPFLLKILGFWAKSTRCKLIQNVPKGEREEHAICNLSCARRVKCSRFNFIKSLTTSADTEDGKYARPENSPNPTVSISIKARCSTDYSNLIKPTNNKGFSLGSVGPRVHSSVRDSCGHQANE